MGMTFSEWKEATRDLEKRWPLMWGEGRTEKPQKPLTKEEIKADVALEMALLLIIHEARENWKAAAWILERRWPERWGDKMTTTGEMAPVKIVVQFPEDDGGGADE